MASKTTWTTEETCVLVENVKANIDVIKGSFNGGDITAALKQEKWAEILRKVNSVSLCGRTLAQVKKKWQDVQSLSKKKEAARLKSHSLTGGGPPPPTSFKEWEKVVISTFSKSQLVGVDGGVDSCYEGVLSVSADNMQGQVTQVADTVNEPEEDSPVIEEAQQSHIPLEPIVTIKPTSGPVMGQTRVQTASQKSSEPAKKKRKITIEDVHEMQYKVLQKELVKTNLQTELLLKVLKNFDDVESNSQSMLSLFTGTF